jgi:hypothetical protein
MLSLSGETWYTQISFAVEKKGKSHQFKAKGRSCPPGVYHYLMKEKTVKNGTHTKWSTRSEKVLGRGEGGISRKIKTVAQPKHKRSILYTWS